MNINDIFCVASFPFTVTMWRASQETKTHHRNPLFHVPGGVRIGLDITRIVDDAMRCVYLGLMHFWIGHVVWQLLLANWFKLDGAANLMRHRRTLGLLRTALFAFYKNHKKMFTRVGQLTLKTFGIQERPKCKLKAAESFGMMHFLIELLQKQPGVIPKQALLRQAGWHLLRMLRVAKEHGSGTSPALAQKLFESVKAHLNLVRELGIKFKPKHHQAMHLVLRVQHFGNFRDYWIFLDESDNRTLASLAKSVHRRTFYRKVFWRLAVHSRKRRRAL